MIEVVEVKHCFREIESIMTNLETTIKYMNPIDHKHHSAYTINSFIGFD